MTTKDYIEANIKMYLPVNKVAYQTMIRELAVMAANMGKMELFRELDAEYLKTGSEIFWENDRAAQARRA